MKKNIYKLHEIMSKILLVMLIFSFIYSIAGVVFSTIVKTVVFIDRHNVEYIKISLQCILGLGVLFLPSASEHK
jgi:cytochrome c biogenesis protein CcdA